LLTLDEYKEVSLPYYKFTELLSKQSLFGYCMKHEKIKYYLPDELTCTPVKRDLFIRVRIKMLIFEANICTGQATLFLSRKRSERSRGVQKECQA